MGGGAPVATAFSVVGVGGTNGCCKLWCCYCVVCCLRGGAIAFSAGCVVTRCGVEMSAALLSRWFLCAQGDEVQAQGGFGDRRRESTGHGMAARRSHVRMGWRDMWLWSMRIRIVPWGVGCGHRMCSAMCVSMCDACMHVRMHACLWACLGVTVYNCAHVLL